MTTKEMSIPEHAQTARDFLAVSDREFAAGDHLYPGLRQTPGKSPPGSPRPDDQHIGNIALLAHKHGSLNQAPGP